MSNVKKAAIKRAQQAAIKGYLLLDKNTLKELEQAYQDTLEEILILMSFYADNDNVVRLEALGRLRSDVERTLSALDQLQLSLIQTGIVQGATLGANVMLSEKGQQAILDVVERSARYVRHFTAADGLQLSDRLWQLSQQHKTAIIGAIQRAVIMGNSASEAAAALLANGETPPRAMQQKTTSGHLDKITPVLKAQLSDPNAAYQHARRLFRTEINRAYGVAFQNAIDDDEDVIGTRFVLSPNHPRVDICDMHASVNRYGLGRGVYPKGKNPWPAHPNTLSYVEVVFADEVSESDRREKQTRIDWLNQQAYADRVGVLGQYKAQLLAIDELKESWINSRVRDIKRRRGE